MVESAASSTESITIRIGIAGLTPDETVLDGRNGLTEQLHSVFHWPSDHSLSANQSVICTLSDESG